jgi:hypothetical protein
MAEAAQQFQQVLEENETLIKTLELMKKQLDIKLGERN